MRLIDADTLKNMHGMKDDCAECDKELRHKSRSCEFDRVYTLMDFCGWIDDQPTIEPERKKGKWNFIGDNMFECTCCGTPYTTQQLDGLRNYNTDPYAPNFCPYCGSYNGGDRDALDRC